MKTKKIIIKGLAVLSVLAAFVVADAKPVKATYDDCLKGVHVFVRDFTDHEATCTQPGCTVYMCRICDLHVWKYDLPALGHSIDKGNIIVMPTATSDGYCIYRCSRCGHYMGDQNLPATSTPLPTTTATPSPSVLEPFVKNPLAAVPTYFDTNMLAVCYIPYHSIVTVNDVLVNVDAIGAQPLAAFLQSPGKYTIKITPNTNPEHCSDNIKTFVVTIPKKAGQAVKVVNK